MPYVIRTLFGMLPNWLIDVAEPKWEFNVDMNVTLDLGGKSKTVVKNLSDFKFDSRLEVLPTGDELIGFDDTPIL